jgi:hypothetical protein
VIIALNLCAWFLMVLGGIGSLVIAAQYNAAIGFASLLWTVVLSVLFLVIASMATNLEIIAANTKHGADLLRTV